MKMVKSKMLVAACGLALALTGGAQADTVVFADNFDGEGIGLNYNSFANWSVSAGTVDLIGAGSIWDFLPGNGRYVDLDGSTSDAGLLSTGAELEAGTYELSFDLAGSQMGDTNGVRVNFGGVTELFILNSDDPFATYTMSLNLAATTLVDLMFIGQGGDNMDALLDNVLITMIDSSDVNPGDGPPSVPTAPTPAAAMAGLALMGVLGLRRKRQA